VSVIADEQTAADTAWPTITQITGYGFSNVCWQRQLRPFAAFAAHSNSCVFPINIFLSQPDYFTSSQTEPGEQQQDGVIAPAQCCLHCDGAQQNARPPSCVR
jgi:hypothetical protein